MSEDRFGDDRVAAEREQRRLRNGSSVPGP
jgi:hypothetical protein